MCPREPTGSDAVRSTDAAVLDRLADGKRDDFRRRFPRLARRLPELRRRLAAPAFVDVCAANAQCNCRRWIVVVVVRMCVKNRLGVIPLRQHIEIGRGEVHQDSSIHQYTCQPTQFTAPVASVPVCRARSKKTNFQPFVIPRHSRGKRARCAERVERRRSADKCPPCRVHFAQPFKASRRAEAPCVQIRRCGGCHHAIARASKVRNRQYIR